jgi:hypothetical protein
VSPGAGPPMHVQRLQEEVLTVESGTMGWQRQGGKSRSREAASRPAPVQRVLFPIVVAVGGLFGLRRRFADAPEPVNRST